MKQKKTVRPSKFFNFLHYYSNGEHIFSTELIDGRQKRIDKNLAIRFDEMAMEEYLEIKVKRQAKKEILYHLQIVAGKFICDSNNGQFLRSLDIEIKRLSKNILTVEDFSKRSIERLISFSKNNQRKEFCV